MLQQLTPVNACKHAHATNQPSVSASPPENKTSRCAEVWDSYFISRSRLLVRCQRGSLAPSEAVNSLRALSALMQAEKRRWLNYNLKVWLSSGSHLIINHKLLGVGVFVLKTSGCLSSQSNGSKAEMMIGSRGARTGLNEPLNHRLPGGKTFPPLVQRRCRLCIPGRGARRPSR